MMMRTQLMPMPWSTSNSLRISASRRPLSLGIASIRYADESVIARPKPSIFWKRCVASMVMASDSTVPAFSRRSSCSARQWSQAAVGRPGWVERRQHDADRRFVRRRAGGHLREADDGHGEQSGTSHLGRAPLVPPSSPGGVPTTRPAPMRSRSTMSRSHERIVSRARRARRHGRAAGLQREGSPRAEIDRIRAALERRRTRSRSSSSTTAPTTAPASSSARSRASASSSSPRTGAAARPARPAPTPPGAGSSCGPTST